MHLWLIITSLSFLLELQVRKGVERAAICLSLCLSACLSEEGWHLQMNQELLQSWEDCRCYFSVRLEIVMLPANH